MEKLEDPGRLRVDLNPLRPVERKLESKRRKSRAPECLGMSRSVSNFEHSETFFGVFLAIFAYLFKKRDEKTVGNPRHSETFRDVPGSWILGVLTRVSARNSKQIETFRDIPGTWIFGVLTRVSARQFEAD